MKKVNKIFLTSLLMGTIIGINTIVNAASFQTKLVANNTNLVAKQEVTIGVSLTSINAGTTGISGFKGTLEYDTKIFETVSQTDMTAQNNWDGITYNETTKELTTAKSTFVKNDEEIMVIKLKVKEGATTGKTVVTLKDITSSTGTEDVKATDVSISLNIMASNSGNTNIPVITNNTISNITTTNTVNTTPNIIGTTNNTVKNVASNANTMPNTGLEDFTVPFIFVGVIFVGVAYINYRKYSDIK